MSRVVIEIRPGLPPKNKGDPQSLSLVLYESADDIPDAEFDLPLRLDPRDPIFEQFRQGTVSVAEVGERIHAALLLHPAVEKALNSALSAQPNHQRPLYIKLNQAADRIPWETLFANQTFLALDSRWPIGRIGGLPGTAPLRPREFRPPLRVMAFLAAAKVDATPEWEALFSEFQNAKFPVQIAVFVAQRDLRDAIKGMGNNLVSCEFVTDAAALLKEVRQFKPHILHFFCHGSAEDDYPQLRLAKLSTFETLGDENEVVLEAKEIVAGLAVDTDRPWVTVLNCCKGAQQVEGDGAASFVRSLVANGLPAAVGMAEAVAEDDAQIFSRAFYGEVLSRLGACVDQGDWIPEWAGAIQEARRQLCRRHSSPEPCSKGAIDNREWTIPVLYIRPEQFVLHYVGEGRVHSEAEIRTQAELDMLRGLVEQSPSLPSELADVIATRVASLERSLLGGKTGQP